MNHSKAFQETFNQTLLGLIIGWGGFSTLIPNMLEGLSTVFDLGSFRALRIFSITFFLLPLLSFMGYWYLRGAKITYQYFSMKLPKVFSGHKIVSGTIIVLNLLPAIAFIKNQFFIYTLGNIDITYLIGYYTLLACFTQWYFLRHYDGNYKENNGLNPAFAVAVFLVGFIEVLLGIGMASFIEPWLIYNSEIILHIIYFVSFYLFLSIALYFLIRKVDRKVKTYKHFALAVLLIAFITSSYPSFSFNPLLGFKTQILLASILIAGPLIKFFLSYPKIEKKKQYLSNSIFIAFEVIFLTLFLSSLQYFLLKDVYEKTNRNYFDSRVAAAKNITAHKIFPLFHLKDTSKTKVDESDLKFARLIYDKNHDLVNYRKKRNMDVNKVLVTNNGEEINLDTLLENNPEISVRAFFFEHYLTLDSQRKEMVVIADSLKSKKKNLGDFYCKQYDHIERTIINQVFMKILDLDSTNSIKNIEHYFHPINYYSKTLGHYRSQFEIAKEINTKVNEISWLDSLSRTGHDVFKIKVDSLKNRVIKDIVKIPELDHALFTSEAGGFEKLVGVNKAKSRKNLFPLIVSLKSQQYIERFKKAQKIFKAYLEDCQRIGLFVLIAMLLVFLMLYWIQHSHAPEGTVKKESIDSLPGGYLNISILITVILIIHIARPIKAQNINPEQPQWMMNLDNWYEKNAIRKFFGAEDEADKTINSYRRNDIKELLKEVGESNKYLKNIENNLK